MKATTLVFLSMLSSLLLFSQQAHLSLDKAFNYEFRGVWIQRINAGARVHGLSYSELMGKLKKAGVDLNRKVLADLAMNHPAAFEAVINKVK